MADYWMKLYIEILDDPKMATLPDRLWRRIIEIFLVAKKMNKDGHIPDTRQIAWLLRMNADDLEHDMLQISTTGIIQREVNGWYIPNFTKRQGASDDAERQRQRRKRIQSQEYQGVVTDESRNVTQSREQNTENREQKQSTPLPSADAVQSCLEKVTGVMPAGKSSLDAIDELFALGVTKEDIEAGCAWYVGNTGPIRYYSSVVGPIKTERAKRIQGGLVKSKASKPREAVEIELPGGEVTEAHT